MGSFITGDLDSIYMDHGLTYEPFNSALNLVGNAIQLIHIHNSDGGRIAVIFIAYELLWFVG